MRDRKERTISETHCAPSGRNPALRVGSSSLDRLELSKEKKKRNYVMAVSIPDVVAVSQSLMSCFAVCCLHISQHIELKHKLESDLESSTYNRGFRTASYL